MKFFKSDEKGLESFSKGIKNPIFFLSILLFTVLVQSQSSVKTAEKLEKELFTLTKNHPTESVYLQTSKDIYETEEDVWFKAYVLNSQSLKLSVLSKTLYVELIQEGSNKKVWEEKYEIKNGFVDGHLYLLDSLTKGDYILAAYTSHSYFKGSGEFYAVRKIRVKNNIIPNLLIIPEFMQTSFSKEEEIDLNITVQSNDKEVFSKTEIEAELTQNGTILAEVKTKTGKDGKANLHFPAHNNLNGLRVKIKAKHKDVEETLNIEVPIKKESTLQFTLFPEGGHLVSGLQNKLAFKAVNTSGNPLPVSGTLFENNTPLLEFKSVHAGMGSIEFIPDSEKEYHIRLLTPKNDSIYSLPNIERSGIVLRLIKTTKEFLLFEITQSTGFKKRDVYFRLQIRGEVYSVATARLKNNVKIKVLLRDLPQGIAEVALFNQNFKPICERLVYVNQEQKLNIKTSISDEYTTREKITLQLKVTDQNGTPVKANLGLSIYDKLYFNTHDPKSIRTHYYLSTQLKGRIYDPVYYFNNKNKNRKEALDLVLLTQGWRSYAWNEMNLKTHKETRNRVLFDEISAVLTHTKPLKKASDVPLIVIGYTPEKKEDKEFILADSMGAFKIKPSHLKLAEGNYFYFKPLNKLDSKDKISIHFTKPFDVIKRNIKDKKIVYPLTNLTIIKPKEVKPFELTEGINKLDEVTLRGEKSTITRDKYLGKLDSIAKLENKDFVCISNILNCPNHSSFDEGSKKPEEGKVYKKLIVNGDTDVDGSEIYITRPLSPYVHPVYTDADLLKKFNLARIKGYYGKKEFYQPIYDKETIEDSLPDYRNTLLWNPSVITNKNGKAMVTFFCSDLNTKFVGNIEGVGGEGLLGVENFEFVVKK